MTNKKVSITYEWLDSDNFDVILHMPPGNMSLDNLSQLLTQLHNGELRDATIEMMHRNSEVHPSMLDILRSWGHAELSRKQSKRRPLIRPRDIGRVLK